MEKASSEILRLDRTDYPARGGSFKWGDHLGSAIERQVQ